MPLRIRCPRSTVSRDSLNICHGRRSAVGPTDSNGKFWRIAALDPAVSGCQLSDTGMRRLGTATHSSVPAQHVQSALKP